MQWEMGIISRIIIKTVDTENRVDLLVTALIEIVQGGNVQSKYVLHAEAQIGDCIMRFE